MRGHINTASLKNNDWWSLNLLRSNPDSYTTLILNQYRLLPSFNGMQVLLILLGIRYYMNYPVLIRMKENYLILLYQANLRYLLPDITYSLHIEKNKITATTLSQQDIYYLIIIFVLTQRYALKMLKWLITDSLACLEEIYWI